MKIEKINDDMIKVTISLNDLEERNIDIEALNYNSPAAQELFWDMMEQAEIELGFNVADSQILIEPVPDEEEGFIITITRLDEDGDFESIQKYIKNRFRKSDLKIKKRTFQSPSVWISSFSSFEDVCSLCKAIHPIFSGESSLCKYGDKFFLIIRKEGLLVTDTTLLELSLIEFGTREYNIAFTEGFLNEHSEILIASNAVEIIVSHFTM